jgi:cell division protein FtsB
MCAEVQSVFVGVPAFVAAGDPLDDQISDALVESLEVDPRDVEVLDLHDKFFVFLKSLPFTFTTATETVAHSADLAQTYEHSVSRLTKTIRRSDKYQTDLHTLRKEVVALRSERDELRAQLEVAESARQQQLEMSKAVEADLRTLLDTISSK